MTVNHTNSSPSSYGPRSVAVLSEGVTVTNIAAAKTDLGAGIRLQADLRPFTKVRLGAVVTTQAANGGELRLEYSVDGGSTWAYFDTTGSGPAVPFLATGSKVSEWETIPAGAKPGGWTVIRAVTISGDGAEDPVLGTVTIELAA